MGRRTEQTLRSPALSTRTVCRNRVEDGGHEASHDRREIGVREAEERRLERRHGSHGDEIHADGRFVEIILRDLLRKCLSIYIVLRVFHAIDGDGGGDDDDVRPVHGELRELLVELDVFENGVDDRQRRGFLGLAQDD